MNSEIPVNAVKEARGWSMAWGAIMFICGLLAILFPLASSIGIVVVLGWLIVVAGVAHVIFAFQSYSIGGFIWKFLLGLLYNSVAIYMLLRPLVGVLSLTLILAALLMIEGAIEISFYVDIRKVAHSGWVLFDGIITLILGGLIWAHWPSTAAWVLGTLVGISLIVSGVSRFMLSLAIRDLPDLAASA